MQYQRRLLPSTSMLMAFDAAASSGSFTLAAQKLHLTQSAVSRQISALENQLGVELFKRDHKPLQLTAIGKHYAVEVRFALQMIQKASLTAISKPQTGSLNLAILPTFGTRWLMPRFPSFLERNPDITINFVTRLTPFDFVDENLHVAVHYGLADWPGANCTFLMGEKCIPVCSPALIEEHQVKSLDDVTRLPLLHLGSRPDAWSQWFKLNNFSPASKGSSLTFEQFSTIAQAAVAGLGAGLLPLFLFTRELQEGELQVIADKPLTSDHGYYLISPASLSEYSPIVAFQEWILEEVAEIEAGT